MNQAILESPEFIEDFRNGDISAFQRVVMATEARLLGAIYRLVGCREEARDVLQEVWSTVYRKSHMFRGDAKITTWLYRVATNHARNRIKYLASRRDRKQDSFDDMLRPPTEGRLSAQIHRPDEGAESRQLEQVLVHALLNLDPDQRDAFILRDAKGLTYEEVSEALGIQMGTVKSRIHRARQSLKESVVAWQRGEAVGMTLPEEMPGGLTELLNQWTPTGIAQDKREAN